MLYQEIQSFRPLPVQLKNERHLLCGNMISYSVLKGQNLYYQWFIPLLTPVLRLASKKVGGLSQGQSVYKVLYNSSKSK